MVEKQGQKIRAGVSPPPPFRAMPERKHFFLREGFPKGWCPPSIYLEPAAVILVKSTCSCFSDQKTAMRQDSWMRALSLYAGVDREGKEISHLVGPTV